MNPRGENGGVGCRGFPCPVGNVPTSGLLDNHRLAGLPSVELHRIRPRQGGPSSVVYFLISVSLVRGMQQISAELSQVWEMRKWAFTQGRRTLVFGAGCS